MLSAGTTELRNAFYSHLAHSTQNTPAHLLLLFYAVECGAKSAYLRRNRLRTTSDISDPRIKKTHDLSLLAKELNLPAAVMGSQIEIKLQRNGESLGISQAHEAWRYGLRIQGEDERALTAWLKNFAEWVKGEI